MRQLEPIHKGAYFSNHILSESCAVKAENLFYRIEPLLERVEKPSRYLNHEWGATPASGSEPYRICLTYPDTYEVGQPNQGLSILYQILNGLEGVACERSYTPWIDMADLMREHDIPLFSLESCTALSTFDVLGIQIPHEMAFTNILETLSLAQIPLLAADRRKEDPLVVGGGPSAYNPEPVALFYDAIFIGEAEESFIELVEVHRSALERGASREEILTCLAQIEGIYVPLLYRVNPDYRPLTVRSGAHAGESEQADSSSHEEATRTSAHESDMPSENYTYNHGPYLIPLTDKAPVRIKKRVVEDFAATNPLTTTIVPFEGTVHDRLSVEVLRGCARGCRFCQAGMIYRPVRERPQDQVVASVLEGLSCTGYDEVSLTSLSTTDHSQIGPILRRLGSQLADTGIRVSIPSQRLDSFGVEMAELVAGSKKGGLTFAPEAGTQRLRDVINKNITEGDLDHAVTSAFEAGWRRLKLYFMMGLPTETDEDIEGIGKLARRAYWLAKQATPPDQRGGLQITVSVSVFIPKAHTPFQWFGQLDHDEVKRRQRLLVEATTAKGVRLNYHEADTSYLEAVLSRSGREITPLIIRAWELGCRFDAWTETFSYEKWLQAAEDTQIDLVAAATSHYELDETLPWDHIDCGVTKRYLALEYRRALQEKITEDCTFGSCTGCGVCMTLDVDNILAEDRHGA